MNDPRGSIWRKWDLHFHTPSSYDYQDGSVSNKDIIDTLKSNEVSVVAITDHHVIDVERIKELKQLADSDITILPGIELRSELGGSNSIHFIGIFPENTDIDSIWTKLQGSLNLTAADIAEKGNDKIYCDLKEASNIINELGGLVTIHAGSKTNTIENITNTLPYKEAIKEDIVKFINIYEIGQAKDAKEYEEKVFPDIKQTLPLILCSDNHNINKYIFKSNLWIKADPTFKGLEQICNEPVDRIYIGDTPPVLERVDKNKTKYIKTININCISDDTYDEEIWFRDIQIDLNHELVAIIGNKGNGKSALADIIGLAGNSKSYTNFSFLNEKKFRKLSNNKAKHFEGTLTWESTNTDRQILSDDPDYFEQEKVKYIPQKYLEVLCNEEKEAFEKELEEVIFSHVPEEERLGKSSFGDLIKYQSEIINDRISIIKDSLSELNEEIMHLEELTDPEYIRTLEELLKIKKSELRTHEESKPKEIKKPEVDKTFEKEAEEITYKITKLSEQLDVYLNKIHNKKIKKSKLKKQLAALERVTGKVSNFYTTYNELREEIREDLEGLEILLDDILFIKVDTRILHETIDKTNQNINTINNDINPEIEGNLFDRHLKLKSSILELQQQLDAPGKKYQKYLEQLKEWKSTRLSITGDSGKEGSIEYQKSKLKEILEKTPDKLKVKRARRTELATEILGNKRNLIELFKALYQPVEAFIREYESQQYPVKFDATLEINNFIEDFFLYVSQKAKGSFTGIDEGTGRLRKLIGETSFDDDKAIVNCMNRVIEHLETDQRDDNKPSRSIKQQIKKDHLGFYNYLFSFDYLIPKYTLKLGDADLSQLSPGEKGALLLIFYLLIDKNDIPLIMDQPEENLDNQSVYELLVKYIKEAKKQRQLIIVTHNPNLAVVCDAEQIIYAKIDKTSKNKVTYKTGSIENPTINKKIVDVLEGTMPAFSNRKSKYLR